MRPALEDVLLMPSRALRGFSASDGAGQVPQKLIRIHRLVPGLLHLERRLRGNVLALPDVG
jgi:hypothetical protein